MKLEALISIRKPCCGIMKQNWLRWESKECDGGDKMNYYGRMSVCTGRNMQMLWMVQSLGKEKSALRLAAASGSLTGLRAISYD